MRSNTSFRTGLLTLRVALWSIFTTLVNVPLVCTAQVIWTADFGPRESQTGWPQICACTASYEGGPPTYTISPANSYGSLSNFLVLSAEFSSCTNKATVYGLLSNFRHNPFSGYFPERSFLVFDALFSEAKPLWLRLDYTVDYFNFRLLETNVCPSRANEWRTYKLRVSDLATQLVQGDPTNCPANVILGISFDESKPEISWPQQGTNFIYVDNIRYYVEPPSLSLAVNENQLQLCWPTNCPGFKAEECSELASGVWSMVDAPVLVSSNRYQIRVPIPAPPRFYRLVGSH